MADKKKGQIRRKNNQEKNIVKQKKVRQRERKNLTLAHLKD
jgi:hypothetical protein